MIADIFYLLYFHAMAWGFAISWYNMGDILKDCHNVPKYGKKAGGSFSKPVEVTESFEDLIAVVFTPHLFPTDGHLLFVAHTCYKLGK